MARKVADQTNNKFRRMVHGDNISDSLGGVWSVCVCVGGGLSSKVQEPREDTGNESEIMRPPGARSASQYRLTGPSPCPTYLFPIGGSRRGLGRGRASPVQGPTPFREDKAGTVDLGMKLSQGDPEKPGRLLEAQLLTTYVWEAGVWMIKWVQVTREVYISRRGTGSQRWCS